ncbi:MAG: DUF1269 domain-containing protein [Dermatophilaceae bacterium]
MKQKWQIMNSFTIDSTNTGTRQILAAAFSTPDGGSRGAAAVAGAYPDRIGNAAVLYVRPDGTPRFVESKDWGGGRGALVGGLLGIIGGPLGMLAGSGIGAIAAKLRDTGFKDHQLRRLGNSLGLNSSAVVIELATDAVPDAQRLLAALGATHVVVEPVDQDVSALFATHPAPQPDPDPVADYR